MKELVKRYIMRKQQRDLNAGVTEDDLNEIKQDISSLRFELLEIFKSNQFKVDVKQNPSKRKRGKLNLEKAMAKNIFDEAAGGGMNGLSLFEPASYDQKRGTGTLVQINSHKGSRKSQKSNGSTRDKPPSVEDQVMNEEVESSKSSGKSTPAMFKIANKIKRLTDIKVVKKTQSELLLPTGKKFSLQPEIMHEEPESNAEDSNNNHKKNSLIDFELTSGNMNPGKLII